MTTELTKLAAQQREALLPQPANPRREMNRDGGGFSWPTILGFAFLTFNSAMAIYRSDGDVYAVAFVASLLFYRLRQFEKAEPNSPSREKLKVAVWILTTMLTVVFSYKVAAIMPLPVQVVVWAMGGATVLGGFYAFLSHRSAGLGHG